MPLSTYLQRWSRYFLVSALTLSLLDILQPFSIGISVLCAVAILFEKAGGSKWLLKIGWTVLGLVGAAAVYSIYWGSMSAAAFSLIALAGALAFEPQRRTFANGFSKTFALLCPVLLLCLFSVVAGLYGISPPAEYSDRIRLSWLEILAVGLLAAYILTSPPLRWPLSMLAGGDSSATLSRYFLLFSALVPTVLGWGILLAYERGALDVRGGLTLLVFSMVAVSSLIVVNGATWAHKLSCARDMAVRRLEESWKARESYFRGLVDDSSVILYIGDREGRCTFLSKKWQEFTGRNPIQDLGIGWLESVHPDDRARMRTYAVEVNNYDRIEPFTNEYRLRRADGEYRWMISTGIPRFDDRRRFQGYVGTVIDVHDHKLQEANLLKDKRAAELSSQTKSQFLANMSHEIRTPLNAILGFADLCSELGCSREERLDFLKRIRCNGDHLLRLIDDILDLAKMESGSTAIQASEFSLVKVLEETIASLRALASRKGLSLELKCDLNLPTLVHSDSHRIKQIVTNLVGNAIKFTANGKVSVHARIEAGGAVAIEIQDTGIGMTSEQQANLFKPFSQGDSSVTRKFGGTGLGLHLSRGLAQSLGGDIRLNSSEVGVGSRFTFTFMPDKGSKARAVSALLPAPPASPRKLYGKKILVAEDSLDSRELIQLYFRSTGAQVLVVENGLEAVVIAGREQPDLILMDVQMPDMDGLEATRRLRASGFRQPIVALTAHALQDEVDQSFEAGCNYHLTKPVNKDVLLSLVGELLQHSPPVNHI